MDMETRVLSKTIEKLLTESDLPAEVKRLVLSEQLRRAEQEADAAIAAQCRQGEEEEKDAESV